MPERCRRCDLDLEPDERDRGLCRDHRRLEDEECEREAYWENKGDCLRDEGRL